MATDVRPAAAVGPSAPAWRTSGAARGVWAVVALGVLVRAWAVLPAWFGSDDLVLQGYAAALPFDRDYLLSAPLGTFMPAAAALQWPLSRLTPFEYWPQALLLVLGHAVACTLFAVLALRWIGSRRASVVAVAVVALSPLTLVTGTTWSSGLEAVPSQIALTCLLLGLLSLSASGQVWPLGAAAGIWAISLGFGDLGVVVPWLALAAVPALVPREAASHAWRTVLWRAWAVWAFVVAATAGYIAAAAAAGARAGVALPDPAVLADVLVRGTAAVVIPGALGGPGTWTDLGSGRAITAAPGWLVLIAVELVVVLAVASSAVSARARRMWAWAGMCVVVVLLVAAVTTFGSASDSLFVRALRSSPLVVVPLALALGAGCAAAADALVRRRAADGAEAALVARRSAAAAVAVVLVVASVVSTARYREIVAEAPARDYVAAAAESLAEAQDGPPLVDLGVSADVVSPLRFPYNKASWVFAPLERKPAFGDPTTQLRRLDTAGVLRPALVEGTAAAPGPLAGCGWFVRGSSFIVLATPVVDFQHVVRIGFLSSGAGTAQIALETGEPRQFTVVRGLSELVITLDGGGRTLQITDLSPGVTLCTDDVRVGRPVVVQP